LKAIILWMLSCFKPIMLKCCSINNIPSMKKVLLITDVNFWEASSGHRVRIAALIQYLSDHFIVTVVNTGPTCENIELLLGKTYKAEFVILEKVKYLNSDGYGRKLRSFLKGKNFHTLIIEYIHCSYFLNFLMANCQVILDTHDIISERTEEFKKFNYSNILYEISKEDESSLFDSYDNVIMINRRDFENACLMTDSSKVLLCPHPFNVYHHSHRCEVKNITFIASAYLPNVDGIIFFIENCWDSLSLKYDVELNIFGTVCSRVNVSSKNKIKVHGYIDDINSIYEIADIIINPVRFGAGLKIKTLEALAHGKPLVTTGHGIRGLEAGLGKAFLAVETTSEFIAALSELIENEAMRAKLSCQALEFVNANFSADECFKPLVEAIASYNNS